MSEPSARENFYPLKLPTELYLTLIDRMAKTKLSKGDCIIDMLTETAYREGLFSKEEHYRFLKAKYGTKTVLEKVLEGRKEKEEPMIGERPNEEVLQARRIFVHVIERWESLKPEARKFHVFKAERFKDLIPEAKEILRKAGVLSE